MMIISMITRSPFRNPFGPSVFQRPRLKMNPNIRFGLNTSANIQLYYISLLSNKHEFKTCIKEMGQGLQKLKDYINLTFSLFILSLYVSWLFPVIISWIFKQYTRHMPVKHNGKEIIKIQFGLLLVPRVSRAGMKWKQRHHI